jgi:hypothetical protein
MTVETVAGQSTRVMGRGLLDASSPYAGWTHVYIPYCTGDLHWGITQHNIK